MLAFSFFRREFIVENSFFDDLLKTLGDCDLIGARAEMRRLAKILSNSSSERDLEISDFLAESSIYFSPDDYYRGDATSISRLEANLDSLCERKEEIDKRISALLNEAYDCFVRVEDISVDNRYSSCFSREKISDHENFNLIKSIMDGREDLGFEATIRIFELQTRFYLFLKRFGVKSLLSLGRKSNIKKGRYVEYLELRGELKELNARLKSEAQTAAEVENINMEVEKNKGEFWWSNEVGFNLRSKFLRELKEEFGIVVVDSEENGGYLSSSP